MGTTSRQLVMMYPLDHEMVPRHRLATPAERQEHEPVASLPVLRSDDAIAQYLALTHGDVVRIDRRDGTVYWRVVSGNGTGGAPVAPSPTPE